MVTRLKKKDWLVRPMNVGRGIELCKEYHYARGASNTSVVTMGLFPIPSFFDSEAQGAAIWIPPPPAVSKRFGVRLDQILALSRLAISPSVPCNGASFLIGGAVRYIRKNLEHIRYLVTYADTMEGHTGAIYRASNWTYDGLTQSKPRWKKNGRLLSPMKGHNNRTVQEMKTIATMEGRWKMHRFFMAL